MILTSFSPEFIKKAIQTEIKINAQCKKENEAYNKIIEKARLYSDKFGISFSDVKLILFELEYEKRITV
jgi:TRAP-type mannitol/chloroaromatic compound transport system substrate-binding protein